MAYIQLLASTTRYEPTEDGDREVLDTEWLENTVDYQDPDEIDGIIRQLRNMGVEFRSWSDPVQIREDDNGYMARATSVDIYVHPGEGWHEEVCADVTSGSRETLQDIIDRVDRR